MEHVIEQHLSDRNVGSVLQVGDKIWPSLQEACNNRPSCFHFLSFESQLPEARFDLGVVVNGFENQPKKSAFELLGLLKNQLCENLWVGLPNNAHWSLTDFMSLGFRRSEEHPCGPDITFYEFDLYDYNKKRSWNNSKYWANPENFNQYRW